MVCELCYGSVDVLGLLRWRGVILLLCVENLLCTSVSFGLLLGPKAPSHKMGFGFFLCSFFFVLPILHFER